MTQNRPDVFFVPLEDNENPDSVERKTRLLFDEAGFQSIINPSKSVAIKTHFGERGNRTHLTPDQIRPLVQKVKEYGGKPFLTETSVLYKSNRSNALDHILLAYEHGFTFENVGAPIIMADGFLGVWERKITINGEFYDKVGIAGDAIAPDALLIVSHATGHLLSGLGATIKNMGMGLSSRMGKLNQHSEVAPKVDAALCDLCKTCIKWCPEDCILENDGAAFIQEEKCIGCGECLAVCKTGAVQFTWDASSDNMQKKMVEHAYGVYLEKKDSMAYITFLTNMTKDCDCLKSKEKMVPDMGIMASFDPIALDMATLDLTRQRYQQNLSKLAYPDRNPMVQIDHGVKLGMGSKEYRLVEIKAS
ncbi:DUF362 domain-containing protein [bacterium]|nr:DUF362 domain-containing protein [bacterium]